MLNKSEWDDRYLLAFGQVAVVFECTNPIHVNMCVCYCFVLLSNKLGKREVYVF